MQRPEVITRNYHRSDEEVLQQSDVKLASFIENKSRFVDRFPQLADPFATEWADAITTARSIPPDYASLANQRSETDTLNALHDEGGNLYQTLILYLRLAFPGDATVLRIFGQQQYDAARRSQFKLPKLLQTAFNEASKPVYKEALIAKGMKETEIDSLKTLADRILNQELVQGKAMNNRSLDASKRIVALNSVWDKMSLVCQCAKLVFQNDAIRYNLFLLSDGDTQVAKAEETTSSLEKA